MQEYVLAYKLHTDSQRLETKFQSLDKQIVQAANGPGMVQPHESYFKDQIVRQKLAKKFCKLEYSDNQELCTLSLS